MPRTTKQLQIAAERAINSIKRDAQDGISLCHEERLTSLISELSAKLHEREWQPIEGAKTDGTWYELLFEGDDDSPNHFDNGYQIYYGYHSLRAWRTKDHVTGNPKYYRAMILPTPHKKDKD